MIEKFTVHLCTYKLYIGEIVRALPLLIWLEGALESDIAGELRKKNPLSLAESKRKTNKTTTKHKTKQPEMFSRKQSLLPNLHASFSVVWVVTCVCVCARFM